MDTCVYTLVYNIDSCHPRYHFICLILNNIYLCHWFVLTAYVKELLKSLQNFCKGGGRSHEMDTMDFFIHCLSYY